MSKRRNHNTFFSFEGDRASEAHGRTNCRTPICLVHCTAGHVYMPEGATIASGGSIQLLKASNALLSWVWPPVTSIRKERPKASTAA